MSFGDSLDQILHGFLGLHHRVSGGPWPAQNVKTYVQPVPFNHDLAFLESLFVIIFDHCAVELGDFEVDRLHGFFLVEEE